MASSVPGGGTGPPGGRCPGSKRVTASPGVGGSVPATTLGGASEEGEGSGSGDGDGGVDPRAVASQIISEWAVVAAQGAPPSPSTLQSLVPRFEAVLAQWNQGGEDDGMRLRLDVTGILISTVNNFIAIVRAMMPPTDAEPIAVAAPINMNEEDNSDTEEEVEDSEEESSEMEEDIMEEDIEEELPEEPQNNPFMPGNQNPFDGVDEDLIAEAMEAGRTFLALFNDDFVLRMTCPPMFSAEHADTILPTIQIIGEAGAQFEVETELINGTIQFNEGWFNFVQAEKIVYGDIGLFVHYAPHQLALYLFTPHGESKPMAIRPQEWSIEVAYGNADNANNEWLLAHPLLDVYFQKSKNLTFTQHIRQQMLHLWMNHQVDYPLYAMRLNKSNIKNGRFYLSAKMSELFPELVKVHFYHENSNNPITEYMRKDRNIMRENIAWRAMVHIHGYTENQIVVLRMTNAPDGICIRVYPLLPN